MEDQLTGQTYRARVRPVGDSINVPQGERMAVELHGGLISLVFHEAGTVHTHICPAASFSASHRRRLDGRILILGLAIPLVYLFTFVLLLRLQKAGLLGDSEWLSVLRDGSWFVGLLAAFGCAAIAGMVFLRRRPTCILHAEAGGEGVTLEFWADRRPDTEVGRLFHELEDRRLLDRPLLPDSVAFAHEWARCSSRSIAGWCAALWPASVVFTPVVLPPISWLLRWLRSSWPLGKYTAQHREALGCFAKADYARTEELLRRIISIRPTDIPAIELLINTYIHQHRLESALALARQLREFDSWSAGELEQKIRIVEGWLRGECSPGFPLNPEWGRVEDLVGDSGEVTAALRPVGKVDVHGETFNARSESSYVEAGQLVEVLGYDGHTMVVRPIGEHEPVGYSP